MNIRNPFPRVIVYAQLLVLGLLASAAGCANKPAEPRALTEAERELVGRSNEFGFRLLSEVARLEPNAEAVVVSPLSAAYALGMTLNGAAGETLSQMTGMLGFGPAPIEEINQTYRGLMDVLAATDPAVDWRLANSLWIDEGFSLLPEYADACQRSFRAEARQIDLQGPNAKDEINAWVEKATRGRIDEMLASTPSDAIKLILLNAIYFKARWSLEFDPEQTKDGLFHAASGEDRPVRMMTLEAELPYLETLSFQAVHLAYANGSFGLTILLPRPETGAGELIEQLAGGAWAGWLSQLEPRAGKLELPRFTLGWGGRLNDPLEALGMIRAFSPLLADFSAMAGNAKARGLHVAFVDQKTWLQVDEQGTEAAAATAVGMVELIADVGGDFTMRVDRPFVLVLHELRSGTVILAGVVAALGPES